MPLPGQAGPERGAVSLSAVPTAERIIVGQVVEDRDPDSDYQLAVFGLRVDEVLRGPPPIETILKVRHLLSGVPRQVCPGGSTARLLKGDSVVLALGARAADRTLINTLAYIGTTPADCIMPGIEEITRARTRGPDPGRCTWTAATLA